MLWGLQKRFYDQNGLHAWQPGLLPQFKTTNAYIATTYAEIVLDYLLDCQAAGNASDGSYAPLDSTHPIYIVELGVGSGRFAYRFLQKFLSRYRSSNLKDVPFKYVMTDFAQTNLMNLSQHPSLEPFVAEGLLDFSRFDTEIDSELTLMHSGETLNADTNKNPVVVIANHFLDSIPQDVFRVKEGKLHESLVTVFSNQHEPDPFDPTLLTRLNYGYDHLPTSSTDYYSDQDLNEILRGYERQFPSTFIAFPVAALDCCRLFRHISSDRLLLLSADSGYLVNEAVTDDEQPGIYIHGSEADGNCFSMGVNFHAIAEYFRMQGGEVFSSGRPSVNLDVIGFLIGSSVGDFSRTRTAFSRAVEQFGPDEFLSLQEGVTQNCSALSLDQIIALLRLSQGDPDTLISCVPFLTDLVQSADDEQKQTLCRAIDDAWEMYFHLSEEYDLPLNLGELLCRMEFFPEALNYLNHSLLLYGKKSDSLYKMAFCYYNTGQLKLTVQYLDEALVVDPNHESAKSMLIDIQTQQEQEV